MKKGKREKKGHEKIRKPRAPGVRVMRSRKRELLAKANKEEM